MRKTLALLVLGIMSVVGCGSGRVDLKDPAIAESFRKASSIRYVGEKGLDYWQTPEETERLRTGDCEDLAIYLQKLLYKESRKSQVEFGFANRLNFLSKHAWVEMKINGEEYILDPALKIAWKRKEISGTFFESVQAI